MYVQKGFVAEAFKNLLLLILVIFISYNTGKYFGVWYDKFSPQYDSFGFGNELGQFIVGVPFAYIFFLVLIFKSFAWGSRNKWTGWLLLPVALLFASGDLKHIYLPIVLGLAAVGLSMIIRKVLKMKN